MDLLEEAGIPPPKPPIITPEDRAELASMALAQSQFYYVCAFLVGLVGGAAIAYYLGYRDIVLTIFKWAISGTGIALILSMLNFGKLYFFKCPRCEENFFWGAPGGIFSKQCGTCGLPLNLPEDVDLTPRISVQPIDERRVHRNALEPDPCTRNAESGKTTTWRVTSPAKNCFFTPPPARLAALLRGGSQSQSSASAGFMDAMFYSVR